MTTGANPAGGSLRDEERRERTETASPDGEASPDNEAAPGWAFDPEQLLEGDDRRGALAAITLIQATMGDDPSRAASRQAHIRFVQEQLDPQRLTPSAPGQRTPVGARRIAEAMAVLIASGGPPFTGSRDLLLSCLGRGDRAFRSAVMEALEAVIAWEDHARARGDSTGSPTLDALGARLLHNPPPPAPVLEDVSQVLWRVDGKRFLEFAFEGVQRHREKYPRTTALLLREIRARLRIAFASPVEWLRWWESQRGASLSEIFAECQNVVSEEAATLWRQAIQRLRETQDAERLLAAVEDALKTASAEELRLAAVAALAEFAGWIREAKIARPIEASGGEEVQGISGDLRSRLLDRALRLLLDVARGTLLASEQPRVSLSAMAALRKHRAVLENGSDLVEPLSRYVEARLDLATEAAAGGPGGGLSRVELLELVRTAGSLRLVACREQVESLLASSRQSGDLELLTAVTAALGELIKNELSLETARLFVSLYEEEGGEGSPPDGDRTELRRACVNGLNALPADDEVRSLVRTFYLRILETTDERELRLGAILGLGTLAQGKDEGALEALAGVFSQPTRFEALEMIGALDAIAYVGGQEALSRFVSLLAFHDRLASRDKAVLDHLWRKVIGLVKLKGHGALPGVLKQLQDLAVQKDSVALLEAIPRLCEDAQIIGLLSTEGLDTGDVERLRSLWVAALALGRASEWAEPPPSGDLPLPAQLLKLQAEKPQIRTKIPAESAALAGWIDGRKKRRQLTSQLDAPRVETEKIIGEFEKLLGADLPPVDRWLQLRWIEKQLSLRRGTDRGRSLAQAWLERIRAPGAAAIFASLPADYRKRCLARLESLLAPAEASPGSGAPPSPTPAPQPPS